MLEILGGGASCIDYDADGLVDLCFPRGGTIDPVNRTASGLPIALLKNLGNWDFHKVIAAKLSSNLYAHGIAVADYDHDGFEDLLVYGYGGVQLFQNQGDGSFSECRAFSDSFDVNSESWISTAAWIDFNGDQNLDLFLGSYVNWSFDNNPVCNGPKGPDVCSPNAFAGTKYSCLLSDGENGFQFNNGILPKDKMAKSLGVLAGDIGENHRNSLYLANDLISNYYFTRQDQTSQTEAVHYSEQAIEAGIAVDDQGVANASMGVVGLDFNLDQKLDLFVTNFEHELMGMYIHASEGLFRHASRQVGLNRSEISRVAFGVVAADFDMDADEDIVFVSGHVHYYPDTGDMAQTPVYLQNESGRQFRPSQLDCKFFQSSQVGRGLAMADLDADSDLDLVATQLLGSPTLIENSTPCNSHWLKVSLVGTKSARSAIGAKVQVDTGKLKLIRHRLSGGSYLSHSESSLSFYWPKSIEASGADNALVAVTVDWPEGKGRETFSLLPDQHVYLIEQRETP